MQQRNGTERERMRRKRHKDTAEWSEYEKRREKKRVRARHLPKNTVNDIQMMQKF